MSVLFAQSGGHATLGDALPYSKGYLGTLNYVTASVDFTEQGNPIDQDGFSTADLSISGVPTDADIVAAYLYFEVITLTADPSEAAGIKFRDQEILLNDVAAVKQSSAPPAATASCWSSGQPLTLTWFRADVLHMLPVRFDKDNKPTPKRIVNSADLLAHGQLPHRVYMPASQGNQIPETAGATLVIVYSDPSQPFRKIVFYDAGANGPYIQPNVSTTMTQTLQGFYKSSSVKSASLTQIIASGQPNAFERFFFNDGQVAQIDTGDEIAGGSSSQRSWTALTKDVSQLMNPGNNSSAGFGETATLTSDHTAGGYDCLTWGAIIFSTNVADDEGKTLNPPDPNPGDGLPDGLEDATNGLMDPDGSSLPNLNQMGASSGHKDLFIEVNALWTGPTSYGSVTAPYDTQQTTKPDPAGHHHLPTPADLALIGDRFFEHGISVHFDVGSPAVYHGLGKVVHTDWEDDYSLPAGTNDKYLVTYDPRGGEVAQERACDPAEPSCHFPAFPGSVGWKLGLQVYRDAPVADNGDELLWDSTAKQFELNGAEVNPPNNKFVLKATAGTAYDWDANQHRRRFDRNRFGLFHYLLAAHARGTPRSMPCLLFGQPSLYDTVDENENPACTTANPDFNANEFHAPTQSSGVADLPGGNILLTLGFFDELIGKPFVRASTIFHEVGHNLNLWHGGVAAIWGNKAPPSPAVPSATYVEPNCKPTYKSSQSYLFQIHGLFDDSDAVSLDYSDRTYGTITENPNLGDGSLQITAPPSTERYRSVWYAPANSALAAQLGVPAATRYCTGPKFPTTNAPSMARVFTMTAAQSIDWNGNLLNDNSGTLDVNLDSFTNTTMKGYDDWGNIRLNQIGAGRRAMKFQEELDSNTFGDFVDFSSGDFVDFSSGDFIDFSSGDFIDFSSGDFVDYSSGMYLNQTSGDFVDFSSGDFVDFSSGDFVDFSSGDFADFSSGGFINFGSDAERQEVDFATAKGLGRGIPHSLAWCKVSFDAGCTVVPSSDKLYGHVEVRWQPVTVGHAIYNVFRKKGDANSTAKYSKIGSTNSNRFIDPDNLTSGTYTYQIQAEFDDASPHQFSKSRTLTINYVK